jgi:hypothetical protein
MSKEVELKKTVASLKKAFVEALAEKVSSVKGSLKAEHYEGIADTFISEAVQAGQKFSAK